MNCTQQPTKTGSCLFQGSTIIIKRHGNQNNYDKNIQTLNFAKVTNCKKENLSSRNKPKKKNSPESYITCNLKELLIRINSKVKAKKP